jgi:arsenate reductase-like glutaredoxin family protein|tara:strand:- start:5986 stop:6261 length:276 start_codon:yes stop_codon:yes gene_type:complete
LEARGIDVAEKIPASRKLQREDAQALLAKASTMVVAKGKKIQAFDGGRKASDEAVTAMLGSTGNLRAPTMIIGKQILVGFNEDAFAQAFQP